MAFEGLVDLFPPELSQNPATTILAKAKIQRVAFFFMKTLGPLFNGEVLELFDFNHTPMDGQSLFTGHIYEGGLWRSVRNRDQNIT